MTILKWCHAAQKSPYQINSDSLLAESQSESTRLLIQKSKFCPNSGKDICWQFLNAFPNRNGSVCLPIGPPPVHFRLAQP